MDSALFLLFIGLVAILGTIVTLVFAVVAIFKRNRKSLKRTGFSLLSTLSIVITLILIHEVILFPPNPKADELILTAYREAQIGGIWLGLYKDSTWEMGNSNRELDQNGIYEIHGDTLILIKPKGETFNNGLNVNQFLIEEGDLIEVKNTGIAALAIEMNKLKR